VVFSIDGEGKYAITSVMEGFAKVFSPTKL